MSLTKYFPSLLGGAAAIAFVSALSATPAYAIEVDPATGAMTVTLPIDLCEFDELPAGLIDILVERNRVNRYYKYMRRECPEKSVQLADFATASFHDDDTSREEDRDRPDRGPKNESEDDDDYDDEYDDEYCDEYDNGYYESMVR